MALVYILDMSHSEPWRHLETLRFELSQFSGDLNERPQLVVANKMDLSNSEENLVLMRECVDLPIIPISAKYGNNLLELLKEIRVVYDKYNFKT